MRLKNLRKSAGADSMWPILKLVYKIVHTLSFKSFSLESFRNV